MIAVPRRALFAREWNDFVDQHEFGWWWHREEWIDYSLAYSPRSTDYSVALVDGSTIHGLIPLVIDHDGTVVCGGQQPKTPLFLPHAAGSCVEAVIGYLSASPMKEPLNRMEAVPWFWEDATDASLRDDTATYVVELYLDGHELLKRVRKSYRHLIRDAAQRYYIHSISNVSPTVSEATIDRIHALHRDAAGRETRSQETWRIMSDWVRDGHALVAMAYADGPVGYAYVIRYKSWSYYASGAVALDAHGDKHRGVAHALQWEAINALKLDGVTKFYELGHAADATSGAKDTGIALFKSGFGGVKMPVVVYDYGKGRR